MRSDFNKLKPRPPAGAVRPVDERSAPTEVERRRRRAYGRCFASCASRTRTPKGVLVKSGSPARTVALRRQRVITVNIISEQAALTRKEELVWQSIIGYDGIDLPFESDSFDLVVTRYAF